MIVGREAKMGNDSYEWPEGFPPAARTVREAGASCEGRRANNARNEEISRTQQGGDMKCTAGADGRRVDDEGFERTV